MSKEKLPQLVTPKGIALYPRINKPDTKFNKDGVFSLKLKVSEKDPETVKFLAKLKEIEKDAYPKECEKQKKKNLKRGESPIKVEKDDNDEPTGNLIISTKQNAKIKAADGSTIDMRVAVFDAKQQPIPPSIKVGGGSVCRAAIEVAPYYTATAGFGLTLRLKAVQVIELVEYTGERSADSYGFDAEEGYEAPTGGEEAPGEEEEDAANSEENEEVSVRKGDF